MNRNRNLRRGKAIVLTITAILLASPSCFCHAQQEPAPNAPMPDRAPPIAATKLPDVAQPAPVPETSKIIVPTFSEGNAKAIEPAPVEVKWTRVDDPPPEGGRKENVFKLSDSERIARPVSSLVLVGQPKTEGGGAKEPAQPTQPSAQPEPQTPSAASLIGLPSVSSASASASAAQASAGVSQGSSSVVSGQNAAPSTGVGDLLANSASAQGVEVQRRSPLVGDPRIAGLHFGQVVTHADGGFWFPGRVDLDSVISKLNTSDIQNILIVKGPFSVRYGSGFSFLDIESVATPRSKTGGFDAHGSTTVNYRTNGQGFQGQQSLWGGNKDWGFRLTYDAQSAGNYSSGNGAQLPSSYNNQFVNFSFGMDLDPKSSFEVRYLHVQQSNVLFPGLLTGVNELASDAFTARYTAKDGPWYDRFTLDTWVNGTTFNGDSANPATRAQAPQLDNIIPASNPANAAFAKFFPVRLDITTNGNSLSYGARAITTWGDSKGLNVSAGADLRVFTSAYNEFDAFNLSVFTPPGTVPGSRGLPVNLGIPTTRQIDPGLLVDTSIPVGQRWIFKAGTRADITSSQFLGFGNNVDIQQYNQQVGDPLGDRIYYMYSGFATGEYKITPELTAQGGYGYAQRAPTATELYAGGAFLGLIQNGLNSIYGDPNLRKEQMHQLNLSLNAKYEKLRAGGSAFYSFVPNYITYNNLGSFQVPVPGVGIGTTPINRLQFVNTPLATLYGFDAYGEYDALPWLTPFATLGFVEGWDQSRDQPLPGIAPLNARAGLRFHESSKNPRWGAEYYARMVATQNLFAASLGEQRTGGFVVHNLRAFWQARENLLVMAGVENIGNLQYREHLDLRTGSGVFQPGVNFYVGMKLTY